MFILKKYKKVYDEIPNIKNIPSFYKMGVWYKVDLEKGFYNQFAVSYKPDTQRVIDFFGLVWKISNI